MRLLRHGVLGALVALLALQLGCSAPATAQQQVAPPSGAGTTAPPSGAGTATVPSPDDAHLLPYPVPPQQQRPFEEPSTSVPAALLSTMRSLFRLGLADPRGCEYRVIEVVTGSAVGAHHTFRTHGWVIPGVTPPRYAVALNGLVYPVTEVGPAADLSADIRAIAPRKGRRLVPLKYLNREVASLSPRTLNLIKVMMLFRAGETALAEQLWAKWLVHHGRHLGTEAADIYLYAAMAWLEEAYNRSLEAYLRRDDTLAWRNLIGLDKQRRAVAAAAVKRGMVSRDVRRAMSALNSVPILRRELRRRMAIGEQAAAVDWDALRALPKPQRIAALIDRLDQIDSPRLEGQFNLTQAPIVIELAKIGEPAVDALINAIEHDQRLTRTSYSQYSSRSSLQLVGAHDAAYAALMVIWRDSPYMAISYGHGVHTFEPGRRRAIAAELRALRAKWHGVPIEQRWYDTLADDDAEPDLWVWAAERITQRTDERAVGARYRQLLRLGDEDRSHRKPALRGEPLRSRAKPSVTQLLKRRLGRLTFDAQWQCHLALALARWDPKGGAAALKRPLEGALFAVDTALSRQVLERCIAKLTTVRAGAGDADALAAYGRWLAGISARRGSVEHIIHLLEPMWRYPGHPQMRRAARHMFISKTLWLPLSAADDSYNWGDLIASPLLNNHAFKQHVLDALSDPTVVGALKASRESYWEVTFHNGSRGDGFHPKSPIKAELRGKKLPLRRCDYYGWKLSLARGAPKLRGDWSLQERDAAVVKLRHWLSRR